jgi:regulator of PEP synthase PpsR (kinase-PPPase family)
MQNFHLHLVSDATGETVTSVARACLVQFEDVQPIQHNWWLVRTQGQVERAIAGIEENPGPVLFTLVDGAVRGLLEEACRQRKIPCISLLDSVMAGLSAFLGAEVKALPGRQYQLDAEYFRRIDAMQFTLSHDDGQLIELVEDADIVLVGVSRTSKTPTCMYIANRGFKCANYPLVPGVTLPPELERAKLPLVVGLTKDPKSLSDIRRARLRLLNQEEEAEYAQFERVKEEVQAARRIFSRLGWPVVDVTRRSIEEAAAAIIQLHAQHLERRELARAQTQAQPKTPS